MTKRQQQSATALELALERCHRAGLKGGVFDSSFCVWPIESPCPFESGSEFFDVIRKNGMILYRTSMSLDGGAGV